MFLEWDGECFSIVQLVGRWLFLLFCWSNILLDASHVALVGFIGLCEVLFHSLSGEIGPCGVIAAVDVLEPIFLCGETCTCVEIAYTFLG